MSGTGQLRRAVPLAVLPLSVVACGLASAPWLRAYPSSVLAAPLFGAALLSVLLPFVVVNIGVRKLWQTVLIDLVGFLFFVTLVALRQPLGYPALWSGLVHGPSQILSYALPLVSPRTLLVAPVALCWLCGAVVGECIGRGWQSVLPYLTALITFGLSYAATQRAVTTSVDGRRLDAILGGALLLCLLLLRAVQVWVDHDSVDQEAGAGSGAAGAQSDSALPVRSVAVGAALAVLIAGGAALAVQSTAFNGRATGPARTPPIAMTHQLSPLSFVAGLRPTSAGQRGNQLFTMTVDSLASRYISIGDVDSYNGDSWSFSRTFRPSGGLVPADTDPSMRPKGRPILQQYTITGAQLAAAPWMPFEFRPQRIIGAGVDIDPASGMIVPSSALKVGQRYSLTSAAALRTFDQLRPSALPGTSYQSVDLQLPVQVADSLPPVISAFQHETHTSSVSTVAFLQALAKDLRTNYNLAGAGRPAANPATSSSPAPSSPHSPSVHRSGRSQGRMPAHRRHTTPSRRPHRAHHASASPSGSRAVGASPSAASPAPPIPSPAPTPSAAPTPSSSQAAGGRLGATSLAAVLASILTSRTATPEQYATLVALIARRLNVPARVATGFRLPTPGNASTVEPGTYTVTTRDAWTWVEIPIQGQGWVVLDPSPARFSGQQATHPAGASHSPRPTPSPPSATLDTRAPRGAGNALGPKGQPPQSHPVAIGLVVTAVAAAIGALILIALVFALLRKWLRLRRRRGAADPRRRVVGAWQETLDVLVESGLADPRTLTSTELADVTANAFGPEPGAQAHYLGNCANLAIFSPTAPISVADAEAAWGAHVALRRAVRRRLSLGQRLASGLRYHRQRRVRAIVGPGSWDAAARAGSSTSRSSRHRARHAH